MNISSYNNYTHHWYWNYPCSNFLDSEDELIEFDDFNFCDIISQSSSETTQSLSAPVPTALLDSIHDKLKLQHDFNKSEVSRSYKVYSQNFPMEMQLNSGDIANLHKHLIQLEKGYDLRKSNTVGFRMFRSITSTTAILPTAELLRHVNTR